jgi:hypothetical protein
MSVLQQLVDPRHIRLQIESLQARYVPTQHRRIPSQDGVRLEWLTREAPLVAEQLARAIADGTYEPRPAQLRRALLDKERELFVFQALDLLLHHLVARLLTAAMEPALSPHLYSYRRGVSSWQAVRDFAAFVRAHCRTTKVVKQRGLFVLRCDVQEYGDSIPFTPDSPIWAQLRALVAPAANEKHLWHLFERIVHPEIVLPDGTVIRRERGIPTGSPVGTAIANLFLSPLDRKLETIDSGFYARYGDDLAIAHRDYDVIAQSQQTVDHWLEEHGLTLNPKKKSMFFFNNAGRPADLPQTVRGSPAVTFLGCRIGFDGTIGLTKAKAKQLLTDIRLRTQQTARLLRCESLPTRAAAVCDVVRQTLDPRIPLCAKEASLLRRVVTDRNQLRQLDYWLARICAEAIIGEQPSPRVFRQLSWRRLRQEWGLPSLTCERNRKPKGKA